MSAIAGLWRLDGNPDVGPKVADDCARMLKAQEIYGPHRSGQWHRGPFAMGRRLFITLPEDRYDEQPLRSRDGRLALVADVRLDNRRELSDDLRLPSSVADEMCDAAILLESLERWGEDALDRLAGDFALALWDSQSQTLLLARDFLGKRPLHYHHGKALLAFASMPKGLHALAEVPRIPDEQAVAELITLMPQQGSRSFFRDISRVEPGGSVTVTREGIRTRRYWEPRRGGRGTPPSDYVEGMRHHLDQATKARLRGAIRGANGTAGAQMSCGLDSSAVASTAARLLAADGGRVIAFTAVPGDGYSGPVPNGCLGNEGPLAAATAAMYPNMEHVLVRSAHLSPLRDLSRIPFLFDRPLLNLCNWNWGGALFEAARDRGVTVLLNGQSGNMTASYSGLELLPEMLAAGQLRGLWKLARGLAENGRVGVRGLLGQTFGPFLPACLWRWLKRTLRGSAGDVLRYTAIRPEQLRNLDLYTVARDRDLDFSYRPAKDAFALRLWVLRRIDMGCDYKGALGGWGVDRRDPLGDRRLVEYCLGVPAEEYLANGVPRSLAIRALADRLPQALLNERRRGYQAVDWHESLTAARNDLAKELDLMAACPAAAKALDIGRMKGLVENWPASGWGRGDVVQSYRLALLRGVSAGHFLRMAAEG